MKKKLLLILINIVFCLGTVGFVLTSGNKDINYAKAKDEPYTLDLFNLSYNNQTLTTSNGNSIEFSVAGYNKGFFSGGSSHIKSVTPIRGLQSLSFSFVTLNANLRISYGWYYDDFYSSGIVNSDNQTFTFGNLGPQYFMIENISGEALYIDSFQLTYSCIETVDPEASANVKYTLSSDGQSYSASPLNNWILGAYIMDEYNGKPVTSIKGFSDCSYLNYISIPGSIGSIAGSAFRGCEKLVSVKLGNGITSIGTYAFSYCTKLSDIVIPNSVTSIAERAFQGCSSLTSVVLSNNLKSIGEACFMHCYKLNSITIPDSVTSIVASAFYYCSSLSSVTLGSGITTIETSVFSYCSSLASIVIPSCVTLIKSSAFSNCTSLSTAILPNNITTINNSLFENCSSLAYITIPDGVTSIRRNAFYGCSSLSSVTIPNTVTSIDNGAFSGCSSLQGNEFDNCCYLGNSSNPYLVLVKAKNTDVASCEISPNCKILCDFAFSGCSKLTSITIPDSITSYGDNLFYNCSSLTSVVLPDCFTKINSSTFGGCSSLISVELPNTISRIESKAFINCSKLTSINIPNSVTFIGENTFKNCSSLNSIFIPKSVYIIDCDAFTNCSSLTIYCERESKPSGWDEDWNYDECPVVWGYSPE